MTHVTFPSDGAPLGHYPILQMRQGALRGVLCSTWGLPSVGLAL